MTDFFVSSPFFQSCKEGLALSGMADPSTVAKGVALVFVDLDTAPAPSAATLFFSVRPRWKLGASSHASRVRTEDWGQVSGCVCALSDGFSFFPRLGLGAHLCRRVLHVCLCRRRDCSGRTAQVYLLAVVGASSCDASGQERQEVVSQRDCRRDQERSFGFQGWRRRCEWRGRRSGA